MSAQAAPIVQFDTVEQFYQALSKDVKLKSVKGLRIIKEHQAVLGTTPDAKNGNKIVIVTQPRCAKFMWNAGGILGQDKEYVQMHIICRSVAGVENARDVVNAIRARIKELLFDQTFPNTGWLWHTKMSDNWPSPPTSTRAHNVLSYEVWSSSGR